MKRIANAIIKFNNDRKEARKRRHEAELYALIHGTDFRKTPSR
jgi:hypothetical protein